MDFISQNGIISLGTVGGVWTGEFITKMKEHLVDPFFIKILPESKFDSWFGKPDDDPKNPKIKWGVVFTFCPRR